MEGELCPPNARSALLFVKPNVGEAYVGGAEAMMRIEPRRGSLYQRSPDDRAAPTHRASGAPPRAPRVPRPPHPGWPIARSALPGAPEALSMVSRGLVARSASYPR